MYSFETLQDFVLNLLNDEAAQTAYAADPLGALADAGLGDLTPQDVDEVIPLVTDALPTGALPTDALPLDALPLDALPLDALPTDALPTDALPLDALPLDALPLDALPTDALPLDALPLDALPTDALPLDALPLDALPLDALPTDALPLDALPTDALPLDALPLDALPTDALPLDALPTDALPLDALPTDAVLGELDLDLDTLTDSSGATTGLSALGQVTDLAYAGGLVNQDDEGVDLWAGAQSAGRLAGVFQTDGSFAEGGVSTPVAYAGANSNGDYLVTTADPADLLDDLGDTTDTAAATATHLVGTGAGSLAGAVDSGADTLAGFLAGTPAAPVADLVDAGADTLNGGLASGVSTISDPVGALPVDVPVAVPSIDDLPVELPELPDLQGNIGEVPALGDLDLPAQLPDLPVELPDLGVDTSSVTNVVANSPVADVVSNSPVSGLTDTVSGATGDLPVVGDLTDDLNLGL